MKIEKHKEWCKSEQTHDEWDCDCKGLVELEKRVEFLEKVVQQLAAKQYNEKH